MQTAIEVENLSKSYRLGQRLGRYVTLREVMATAIRRGAPPPEYLWALHDVSFSVEQGGTLGVIGPNGAGKTTLLKVLARITEPTTGVSRTRGRAGALLDVGTGFHPELTGRENIYLNAAILGMSRRDVRRRFEDIVDFSGLERFLDTPLKRYSWGMYLRLAFAVAAHVEPEVVIVDEVLAVGDLRFREKCLAKMSQFGREGRTVVFVSHDLGSITQVCRRAIWLDHGGIVADGPSEDVVRRYVRGADGMVAAAEFVPDHSRRVQLLAAAVTDDEGNVLDPPQTREPMTLSVRFIVREPLPTLDLSISVHERRGLRVLEEVWGVDTGGTLAVEAAPREYVARLNLPPLLPAGDYVLSVWLGSAYDTLLHEEALRFRVWPRPDDPTHVVERDRIVQPTVSWELHASPAPTDAAARERR
jgi:ABC-2 type transport system ATP-binding protein/lipopolysaccharide transport system ATP-binding protein